MGARTTLRVAVSGIASVGWILLAGCAGDGGGDPVSRRAAEVFDESVAAAADYKVYALTLAPSSASPRTRALVLETIGSDDRGLAVEAIRGVGERPDDELRGAIQAVFDEKTGALKLAAALALAEAGDADAVEWLRGQVDEAGALAGADAFRVLAAAGDRENLEAVLRERVASDDPAIRNEAYRILGGIRELWAVGVLLEGLGKEHGEGRLEPLVALGRSGIADVAPRVQRFTNTRGLVLPSIEALGALGNPDSIGHLEKLTGHDEPRVVAHAGVALWRLGAEEPARAALEPLLDHEDPGVRRVLAEQLALVPEPAADAWLGRLAADPDKSVQIAAVRGLAGHDSAEAVAAAAAAAGDDDYEVATLAINLLSAAGNPGHREALAALLESPNPYIALAAADAVLSIDARHPGADGPA